MNQVMMYGRLSTDTQLSFLPGNTPVCEFNIAVSKKFKKQDGSQGEETCFVTCKLFGKRGEVINKYFAKGDPILITGRLRLDRWQAQDGSKRSKHWIFVENFEFTNGIKDKPTQQEPQKLYGNNNELDNSVPF